MRIILGADHGGFLVKEIIKQELKSQGIEILDVGAESLIEDDDFVDYAKKAVLEYKTGDMIVLFCRNGFGMEIVANRARGIRCGVGFDEKAVTRGRTDDDINCLSIPADYLEIEQTKKIVETFLHTGFSGDQRYLRRINKIDS